MEHAVLPYGCVHALPGRLRVRVTAIKKAPEAAKELEQRLQQAPGVMNAGANPLTGSVLVHYDPERTGVEAILARLAPYAPTPPPTLSPLTSFSHQLGKELGKELVKIALAEMLPGSGPVEVLFALF